MKTLNTSTAILICLVLTILTQISCRTEKSLNRQNFQSSNIQEEDTHIQSLQRETTQSNRLILTSDSANNSYRVNIFPLDTITFSMQHGFKGKVSKIEIAGTDRQLKRVSDSTGFAHEKQRDVQYHQQTDVRQTERSDSKIMQKANKTIVLWMGLAFLGLIAWVYWRIRKQKLEKNNEGMFGYWFGVLIAMEVI